MFLLSSTLHRACACNTQGAAGDCKAYLAAEGAALKLVDLNELGGTLEGVQLAALLHLPGTTRHSFQGSDQLLCWQVQWM